MARVFSHPLARAARVWRAEGPDGSEQRVLVVVTTLELDPNNNRYKAKLVEKVTRAAKEHLEQSPEAASFVIMNPLRQWGAT
jgi:phenylpyruvate tautomerase PptA (4-oxalocrotonate tautomerase family)